MKTYQRKIFFLVPTQKVFRAPEENRFTYLMRRVQGAREQRPSGGVKVIYQHCEALRRAGWNAWPVHLDNSEVSWLSSSVSPIDLQQALGMATRDDIVVCPEVIPETAGVFPCQSRVLFVQNHILYESAIDKCGTLEDMGYSHVLTCGQYLQDYMKDRTNLPVSKISNAIDLSVFYPDESVRETGRIMYMNRKNVDDARAVFRMIVDKLPGADIVELNNGLSQQRMALEFRLTDIFVATGYPEGFGLPPLEAMASGCTVAGFTGGGASEYMIDGQTALVAQDGDVNALARSVLSLYHRPDLKETIRQQGYHRSIDYDIHSLWKNVPAYFDKLSA